MTGPTEDQTGDSNTDNSPYIAKLISEPSPKGEGDEEVRVGSPFRVDPPARAVGQASGEAAYADYGPFLYTAIGASTAAIVVIAFAALGCFWFPPGGVIVAILGSALSLVGLFSTKRFRIAAMAALPIHVGLFFLSYTRSLS